jgi:hypothetical protein
LLSAALMPKKGPPTWLEPYLARKIRWDPGTFSAEARTYPHYREWLDRYVQSHHDYLSYDEIGGDPELNMAYLNDLRKRGYKPIPVYHKGMPDSLLREPRLAIGGLVAMSDAERLAYLDDLFYRDGELRITGEVHLLGVCQRRWFERYHAASGDSTTWIPRFPNGQAKTGEEWMTEYGEREIPFIQPALTQRRFAI